jgi:hypothetical protein
VLFGLLNLYGAVRFLANGWVDRFFVRPVRADAAATPTLVYNASTYEITYTSSSIRYKENVTDLSANTSVLHNLRAREYDAKASGAHHIGYIAEEADEASPHFAWKKDNMPEGIEWFNILVYAVEEIKKLKARNDLLESKIEDLSARLGALENK